MGKQLVHPDHRILFIAKKKWGLSWWLSGEESTCDAGDAEFDPWIRKILWRRKWQPTPVYLPREFHGQRSLVGCSPCGHKRLEAWLREWTTTTKKWTLKPLRDMKKFFFFSIQYLFINITMNKSSGGDGIRVEPFQILKDDAVTVLYSICQQIWKTQQWP